MLWLEVMLYPYNSTSSCQLHQLQHGTKSDRLDMIEIDLSGLTPLLMQSGLQSVGDGAISTFARVFALKMCETDVSRLRTTWTFLQDLSRAVSRFSRCPIAGNHLQYLSDPTGPNTITIPDWVGKKRIFRSDP